MAYASRVIDMTNADVLRNTPELDDPDKSNLMAQAVSRLAQQASLEANVHDERYLDECKSLVAPDTRMYVSHLPGQSWQDTCQTSIAVRRAGFNPVPHIPVRLLESDHTLHVILDTLSTHASVNELLLISGDYPESRGPYSAVIELLRQFPFERYGINTLSLAGHPEGHPKVALPIIRAAEIEKCIMAIARGFRCRLVTQFFFEADPFIEWCNEQELRGMHIERIAGIAGPASVSTLFKFALRCGVGPSLRALGVKPGAILKLLGDHKPDALVQSLAAAQLASPQLLSGIHLFCFGGMLKTCKWLQAVAQSTPS
jgi:methylenetetrahydrofolate reductase (NADPH)